MSGFVKMYTEEGEKLPVIPWNEYPRPLLKRNSFFCLNGDWDFGVCIGDNEVEFQKITVPYSPESLLSGINKFYDETEYDYLLYKKEYFLPDGFKKDRVILNFDAVGNYAKIYVNGRFFGEHIGGYDPFSFDITDVIREKNTIVVHTKNFLRDNVLPYGKQSRKRGGMWYTPTSGIWQTVWLESVPEKYIKSLNVITEGNRVRIEADGADSAKVYLKNENSELSYEMHNGICEFEIENKIEWSPVNPYLYYYTVESEYDRVKSYFAFRKLEIKTVDGYKRLCLNGKPYFFHGLLDQGYWSDGGMTPPSPASYEKDILSMKSLGFNMLRKHIKIEPARFYYDCDRLGMVVFQDMINNGDYSFIRDTALPTVGMKYLNDKFLHRDRNTRKIFVDYMKKTAELLKGYPCICCYTIFNEGWGQFCGNEMYKKLKSIDSTRFIDTASGWFSPVLSDVDSKHVYFKKVKLKAKERPLVLSEFGGYSYRVDGHIFNPENEYGYGKYSRREDFVKAFRRLYETEILPLVKLGLCASVYTQVSDVEDETNGIYTYDRRVLKIKPEEFSDISENLKKI